MMSSEFIQADMVFSKEITFEQKSLLDAAMYFAGLCHRAGGPLLSITVLDYNFSGLDESGSTFEEVNPDSMLCRPPSDMVPYYFSPKHKITLNRFCAAAISPTAPSIPGTGLLGGSWCGVVPSIDRSPMQAKQRLNLEHCREAKAIIALHDFSNKYYYRSHNVAPKERVFMKEFRESFGAYFGRVFESKSEFPKLLDQYNGHFLEEPLEKKYGCNRGVYLEPLVRNNRTIIPLSLQEQYAVEEASDAIAIAQEGTRTPPRPLSPLSAANAQPLSAIPFIQPAHLLHGPEGTRTPHLSPLSAANAQPLSAIPFIQPAHYEPEAVHPGKQDEVHAIEIPLGDEEQPIIRPSRECKMFPQEHDSGPLVTVGGEKFTHISPLPVNQ